MNIKQKLKIDWSGRSHSYSQGEISYLTKIIKYADPLSQGKYLQKFENDFSNYIKKKNVFAVSSAAAALEIIAVLLNLKKGDEVIIPAHTYCASAISFARNGAKIVWGDINFKTRVIDIDDIKKKITKKTKAIIIVHLYGYTVNFNSIINYCKKRRIKIIEDCAQSIGSELNGRKSGTMGDFACFSFHSAKNITTLGEGGMIYVKDKKLANKVRGLRHNGHCDFKFKRNHYWLPAMGNLDVDIKNQWPFKFTLSEVQCGAGIVMLNKLDLFNNIRIKRAKKLIHSLKEFKELDFNAEFKGKRHVYHLLSAYFKPSKNINRDDLINLLYKKHKIKCAIQYYPLYRYDLFKKMKIKKNKCKNTDKFYDNMISFPFHLWMTDSDFSYLIRCIKKSLIELRGKNTK
jgi:perosamine synthetase